MILKHARYLGSDHLVHTGDIKISSSVIGEIADNLDPNRGEEIFDCTHYLILPSLADCHVHTPDTLLRGLNRDMPMKDWCNDSVQGKLQRFIFDYLDGIVETPAFRTLVLYAYMQYVKQGVSFIVETGQADESSAVLQECAQEIGIKALVDYYDQYPPEKEETDLVIQGTHLSEEEDLTEEILEKTRIRYAQDKPFLMTHCLETSWRRAEIKKKFGLSTIELLAREHMLGEKTILFHCVETTEDDILLLAKHQANVVHCPLSNIQSSEGNMNLCSMLQQKINVTLGTDFITHDLWDVMRTTYGELKQGMHPELYTANIVFDMVTTHAAPLAEGTGYCGIIEEGNSADLCFIKLNNQVSPLISLPGFSNIMHNIVLYTRNEMIDHVMSNGVWIMQDKKFLTIDEEKIRREYSLLVAQLFQNK
ncbi:cytosine deaminase-like metal-dependent hydrolase [Sphaerochaeta pleomorpha str. Grapes]|uniref:Cytosine deaminase-like metal-dependent hydrolase n=1 Tax=Sphaerochaeta pleomorpha (strain ATCC BAA-1885 / DSM 22778 / Grapes) TaxID=158190 RepID=G8QUI5_SPHPG|nr:amidohydrolase family protein [Sphaerochaeta pleomorpha]AEV29218.1 cytosine deaminase-like metal-dependent hydrolase [Sphaerochaeta pleomorpha str. Grapes]